MHAQTRLHDGINRQILKDHLASCQHVRKYHLTGPLNVIQTQSGFWWSWPLCGGHVEHHLSECPALADIRKFYFNKRHKNRTPDMEQKAANGLLNVPLDDIRTCRH